MFTRRIEEVSLNSWPALQHILYDGWILRFSKGYTKRANSVNPLFASSIDVDQKIDLCQDLYAKRGLRPTFRITPFSSPTDLDRVLASRNYQVLDVTLVMYLDIDDRRFDLSPPAELREEALDDWMGMFCRIRGVPVERHQTHKEILEAIPSRRFLASLADGGRIVACGVGVLENDYLGLFDLITETQQRNKGYGTKLVSGLLRWARENGARHVYLQAVEDNAPAQHLYEKKLGFREIYRYWYRIPG